MSEFNGHCKDCRWFHESGSLAGWGWCRLFSQPEEGVIPERLAAATSLDDYANELSCSPDFGCIQFEPKGKE